MKANINYFESPDVWDSSKRNGESEQMRLAETAKCIPQEARSLLDVGCGSGIFLNYLAASKRETLSRIAGVDLSAEALKSVKCEKHQCEITQIPFEDQSFDVVTALEVLEHVIAPEFNLALAEIKRIAKNHILITVPNEEDLIHSLIICRKCFCCFNPFYHVRSFSQKYMAELFGDFELVELNTIGPLEKKIILHPIVKASHLFLRPPSFPPGSICPQCHHQQPTDSQIPSDFISGKRGFHSISRAVKFVAKYMAGRTRIKKKWLLALYKRKPISLQIDDR